MWSSSTPVGSARPRCDLGVPRLHAIDATRVHLTMKWVVSFSNLRPFGPFPVNTMLRAGKDEHFAITCSDDKTVRLWDVRTGKQHRKFVGHQDYVFACSVHPTSTLFCSGSFDETIKLWILAVRRL